MAERLAKFESNYKNVWSSGPTGASMVHLTVENRHVAEDLIMKLFQQTLIADVSDFQNGVSRRYLNNGKMVNDEEQHSLIMITSDNRVAELIEAVAASQANKTSNPGFFDLVVSPLATGSKEYIQWVKEQTQKVLDTPAFYNEKPPATTVKPLTSTVEEKKKEEAKPASETTTQIKKNESDDEDSSSE